jgi:hypothetical protein
MQITDMMQINLMATILAAHLNGVLVAGNFDQFTGLYPVSQFKVVQEGQFLHFILLHAIIPQGFG